jgi:alkanesulfonate monooxygenase SsuD/methylene tetrahydromethanopterin reductase-like flavin-dependent oxidoreductase (luciferase family)
MKYGFVLPRGDARTAVNFAQAAEEAGWDGFFVWEPVWGVDAWVSLAAAAMVTSRIRLGTMITPISRMRPWKLASETAALDNLSGGRVILSVGLGAVDTGFEQFGEVTDRKTRAELLDEGLDILTGLWAGQPFAYEGKHYHVKPTEFQLPPPPIQQPRIPIWVVGAYPSQKSLTRALRYDGLLPAMLGPDGKVLMAPPTYENIARASEYVRQHRPAASPFEIIVEGATSGTDRAADAEKMHHWHEAGATWWIEAHWEAPSLDEVLLRIRQGPPGENAHVE